MPKEGPVIFLWRREGGGGANIIYFWSRRWGKEDFIRQEEMIFERRGGYVDFCFQTA